MDSFGELPKEKRPPEKIAWDGTSEDIDEWFDRVFPKDNRKKNSDELIIYDNEIEG